MKQRIFIGGSSEELGTAKIVKALLENDFDVTIWNDSIWDKEVFKINNNFLHDLLKAPLKFDFGILIGTPDDKVEKRGVNLLTARDNILFELGLFIGKIGMDKCAYLVADEVDIPSDLGGIFLTKFNKNNLVDIVSRIKKLFLGSDSTRINFFPSSTLAYGYFENFVKPLCEVYFKENNFIVDDVKYNNCNFNIIIPNKLSESINIQYQQIKNDMGVKEKKVESAGRSRNYNVDVKHLENGRLEILDFPTTLTGINYAIKELLPDEYRTNGDEYKTILNRELDKFVSTLQSLIDRNTFNSFVSIQKWDN